MVPQGSAQNRRLSKSGKVPRAPAAAAYTRLFCKCPTIRSRSMSRNYCKPKSRQREDHHGSEKQNWQS